MTRDIVQDFVIPRKIILPRVYQFTTKVLFVCELQITWASKFRRLQTIMIFRLYEKKKSRSDILIRPSVESSCSLANSIQKYKVVSEKGTE